MSASILEANRLIQAGQYSAAKTLLDDVCQRTPENGEAWQSLALALVRLGDFTQACDAVNRAVELQVDDAALHMLAANIFLDAGQRDVALTHLLKVGPNEPQFPNARNQAGILLSDMGRYEEAESAFRGAILAAPDYARAIGNLASLLLKQRKVSDALTTARQAIRVQADYAHAYYVAGSAAFLMGRTDDAIEAMRQALALQPAFPDALMMLAGIHRQMYQIEPALAAVRELLRIVPDRLDAMSMLGELLSARGDLAGASMIYADILAKHPNNLQAALRKALMLPIAYASSDEVDRARAAIIAGLNSLFAQQAQFPRLPQEELLQQIQHSNFYLAYQGRNDLSFQQRYAEFVASLLKLAIPDLFVPMPQQSISNRRVRVGFVSRFFYDSTVGNYFESWITDLDRDQFEVFVYYTHTLQDHLTERVQRRADFFLPFEPDFMTLAKQIKKNNLDILVFPELGMDARVFALAACRLAPVQATGWGHPVTTGHTNVDFFISCAAMEPPGAVEHYSESLALLPGLGTRYRRPELPAGYRSRTRADYQLPEGKNLYLVPQSLFKIHPDNDALLVDVLARDPNGVLVMFAGQAQAALGIFINRLSGVFARNGLSTQGRVKILPDVSRTDYLRINELCDLMLDSLHWSGGNTSLDALAVGLPVVTLPGELMRSRQSMAMLQMIGCEELIAADRAKFVDIAAALGKDASRRKALATRILAGRGHLFDDGRPTAELAKFFLRVTNASDV